MPKRRKRHFSLLRFRPLLLFIVSGLLSVSLLSEGANMFGWFKKQDVFLSSEVKGVVTENGNPVANLEVIRKLIYTDEKVRKDVAVTDSTGHFYFPQKSIRSSIPNKPFSEDRVWQEIFIDREGVLIPFWVATHVGIKEMPEFTQKLAFLRCELSNKQVDFEFKNNHNEHLNLLASSICRWDEDYMPFWLFDGDKEYSINNGDFNNLTERNIKED